jgi:hypothetical protein
LWLWAHGERGHPSCKLNGLHGWAERGGTGGGLVDELAVEAPRGRGGRPRRSTHLVADGAPAGAEEDGRGDTNVRLGLDS